MKKSTKQNSRAFSSLSLTRITRTIYFLLGFYALSIVIFDSGNLITREALIDRWLLFSFVLLINTLAWYFASQKGNFFHKPSLGIFLITFGLLAFAGFTTYWERGMASTSTIFYVLPLLTIAVLKNRHALIATATLAAGTYALSAVKYFNDFFNEGFRIQLWGSIILYGGVIFTCTWLIMEITGLRHDSK